MLRISLAASFTTIASIAIAHPGHIEPMAGHSHYVVPGALIAAAAIVVLAFRKSKSSSNV